MKISKNILFQKTFDRTSTRVENANASTDPFKMYAFTEKREIKWKLLRFFQFTLIFPLWAVKTV
jgi:hypothetical protein